MENNNDIDNEPMTVKDIREVLIPAMEEVFATKTDFEGLRAEIRTDFASKKELTLLRNEFSEFKDKTYTYFDSILKDLEILKIEKEMGYHQKQKERKLWAVMIKAMQEHNILSAEQMKTIKDLEVF